MDLSGVYAAAETEKERRKSEKDTTYEGILKEG
jgi:hypothetical protein